MIKKNWTKLIACAMIGCYGFMLIAACAKGTSDDLSSENGFNSKMNGKAYLGKTKSTLYLGGYESLPAVEGLGSFNIDKISGDSSTLALVVELNSGDGFTFGIPGKQDDMSWQTNFPNGSCLIKANGEIDAKMITAGKEITWDGHLFDDKLMLDIRIKYLENENEITAGSILATRLELASEGSGESTGNGNGCKNIVWESRAIFNIYSGGVDLINVPVCHP